MKKQDGLFLGCVAVIGVALAAIRDICIDQGIDRGVELESGATAERIKSAMESGDTYEFCDSRHGNEKFKIVKIEE